MTAENREKFVDIFRYYEKIESIPQIVDREQREKALDEAMFSMDPLVEKYKYDKFMHDMLITCFCDIGRKLKRCK